MHGLFFTGSLLLSNKAYCQMRTSIIVLECLLIQDLKMLEFSTAAKLTGVYEKNQNITVVNYNFENIKELKYLDTVITSDIKK